MKFKILLLFILILLPLKAFAQDNINNNLNLKHPVSTFTDIPVLNKNIPIYTHHNDEYKLITNEPNIMVALDLMAGTFGDPFRSAILGNNLSGKPIKISFANLSKFSHKYTYFDGLGWEDKGQLYIYISEKHKTAPPEAIGSLLCNLAVHQDKFDSLDEETYAWTMEAAVWLQMKKRNPQLDQLSSTGHSLLKRENAIGEMFVKANYTDKLIREKIESLPAYINLPKKSPDFDDDN